MANTKLSVRRTPATVDGTGCKAITTGNFVGNDYRKAYVNVKGGKEGKNCLLSLLRSRKPYGMMIQSCNTLVQKDTNPVEIAGVAK
jgi:hypothetical protein